MVTLLALSLILNQAWNIAMTEGARLRDAGKYVEAEARYRDAVREAMKDPKEEVLQAVSLNELGMLCAAEGKYREAETIYLRSLDILQRVPNADPVNVAITSSNLAGTYAALGEIGRAESYYRRAIDTLTESLGADSFELIQPLNNFAALRLKAGDNKDAEELLLRALALAGKFGPTDISLTGPLANLGEAYRRVHRLAEAEAVERRALAILEANLPAGHPQLATPLCNLAIVLDEEGHLEEAAALYAKSLGIRVKPQTLLSYAALLREQKHKKEAKELENRAHAMLAKSASENQTDATVDWHALAFRAKE